MKKTSVILTIVFTMSFAAAAQTTPAKVENYLKRNYPGWAIGKTWAVDSAPRKAIEGGDFNGDG